LGQSFPESQGAVAGGQLGIDRKAARLHVEQEFHPALLALAVAIGDGNEFLLAVGRSAECREVRLSLGI
jgi:hypothetical protein